MRVLMLLLKDVKPDGTLSTIMNVATAKRAKTTRVSVLPCGDCNVF